jgi:Holliday junction resolvase-like predicted endonuclease
VATAGSTIMRAANGTLVFSRCASANDHTAAGAQRQHQRSQRAPHCFATRHYLRFNALPPCRFDVVLVQARAD